MTWTWLAYESIADYRQTFEANYDYSYKLAQVFERIKQKDSALKFYAIYFWRYKKFLNTFVLKPPSGLTASGSEKKARKL